MLSYLLVLNLQNTTLLTFGGKTYTVVHQESTWFRKMNYQLKLIPKTQINAAFWTLFFSFLFFKENSLVSSKKCYFKISACSGGVSCHELYRYCHSKYFFRTMVEDTEGRRTICPWVPVICRSLEKHNSSRAAGHPLHPVQHINRENSSETHFKGDHSGP